MGMKKQLRVLIVEDEPTNREVAAGILGSLGHDVVSVTNGQEAIDLIDSGVNGFDIVLMDVLMPVMDGFSATRQLRERETTREVPIVCVSAKSSGADERSGLSAGCDYYLPKPYRARQLLSVMTTVLQERGILGANETIS
jgi:two-component system cell cycle response regulator DivK